MKLDFKCFKCGSNKYYVKTTFLPERESGLQIKMGMYYLKTCAECGFTEMYSAKVINKDEEKKEKDGKNLKPKMEG